jgi:hypothetical protein
VFENKVLRRTDIRGGGSNRKLEKIALQAAVICTSRQILLEWSNEGK